MNKKTKLDVALENLKARKENHKNIINEMVSKLRDSDRRTPGRTIDMKQGRDYTVVNDNQQGKKNRNDNQQSKKNRPDMSQTKPDGPSDARTKRGERRLRAIDKLSTKKKDVAKKVIQTTGDVAKKAGEAAKATGKVVKSATSGVSQGYGQSSFK